MCFRHSTSMWIVGVHAGEGLRVPCRWHRACAVPMAPRGCRVAGTAGGSGGFDTLSTDGVSP